MTRSDSAPALLSHPWVEPTRVHRNAYLDGSLFEEELRRIFGRTWVYVAHESEVANPGDFKTTVIGRQPVIVSRDETGEIHVLMNRCAHRAATVCQAASGNSSNFRCDYHGWTYRNNGQLVTPTMTAGYAMEDFDRAQYSLAKAPRVDSYRGLIFASLSPEGQSLGAHLGRAREYIDLTFDLSPTGSVRLGAGAQKYAYAGNWKLQSENGVDGYHPNFVHRTFFANSDFGMGIFGPKSKGRAATLGGGHGLLDLRPVMEPQFRARLETPQGQWLAERLAERLGSRERAEETIAAGGSEGFNLLIFPNLQIIGVQFRVIHPRAVDHTEVEIYPFLHVGAPQEVNTERLRWHETFYGPAGGGGPDDVEMFDRVTKGLSVEGVEWLSFMRGLNREEIDGETRWGHITDEQPQRGFYEQWLQLMGSIND